MEQVYHFKDWTSAARMKNVINPCLIVDIGVIRDNDTEQISGYQLTVVDTSTNRIIYRYYIDYSSEGTWSLTTEKAIRMLNTIGFPCEFEVETYPIERVKPVLESLLQLGYTQICKSKHSPLEVLIFNPDIARPIPLGAITEYNYNDYAFLPTVPTSIQGILDNEE